MDKRCFQYAVNVALNYEEVKRSPERISNINFYNSNVYKKI